MTEKEKVSEFEIIKENIEIFLELLKKEIEQNKNFNNESIINQKRIVNKVKKEFLTRIKIKSTPTDIELTTIIPKELKIKYKKEIKALITKPSRTISGVSPIALMTKPTPCPHGKCIYCPGGVDSIFGDTPQSYTGNEPAARRAKRNNYDPYLQAFNRLEQYTILNQNHQKCEIIIMGGTFPSYSQEYQEEFIYFSYKALNDFSQIFYNEKKEFNHKKFNDFFMLPRKANQDIAKVIEKIKELKNKNIKKIENTSNTTINNKNNIEKEDNIDNNSNNKNNQKLNDFRYYDINYEKKRNQVKSNIKVVALCIETKPDYLKKEHIIKILSYGTTRVEIGVQSINDKILSFINRGHTKKDIIKATKLAKDSFLKIGYHIMPGLPKTTKKEDINTFKELFSNGSYSPDALKIYPCMTIKGTKLYDLYKKKEYIPLTQEELIEELIQIKQHIPKYVRIMRIQRDIPSNIPEVSYSTNLRQIVKQKLTQKIKKQESDIKTLNNNNIKITNKEKLHECNCIRCKELSRNIQNIENIDTDKIKYEILEYTASNSIEIFISAKYKNYLIGFLRLRKADNPFIKEIPINSVGIREVHVYGESLNLSKKHKTSSQHIGIGKKLIEIAEKIAKQELKAKEILVISGIGVKEYYKKLGYKEKEIYLYKNLENN